MMTLPRHGSDDPPPLLAWSDVVHGAPSIMGFAALCGRALATDARAEEALTPAAQAILHAARGRASIEIKATRNAYESSQRMLAVHVEVAPERWLAFRDRSDPRFTLAMLDGFRQLCALGLVMHHHGHDFSLTHRGLVAAASIDPALVANLVAQAVEIDFGE
jgi:hypothetical protein